MPTNALAAGALPGTGADAGPITSQGPQVDASAMKTPPASPTPPTGATGGPGGGPGGGAMPGQAPGPQDIEEALLKTVKVDTKLRGLLSKDGPIKRKDVIAVATEIVAERVMSAQAMAQYLSDMPEDPEQIKEWVQQHATTADNNLDQLLVMLHQSGEQDQQQGGAPTPPGG